MDTFIYSVSLQLQMQFYQQPPSVVPWPQATSPGYFEAAASAANSFVHFVSNPPQQPYAGAVSYTHLTLPTIYSV